VTTLLKAFSCLLKDTISQDLKLVIAGGKGWGCEEPFGTVKTLGLDDMRDWREALKGYLIDRGTTLKAV
jgi:hypothetical protein